MVSDELDALQNRFPVCKTLAYADLTTGMVLVTNSNTPLERHGLNQLSADAALLLGGADDTPQIGAGVAASAIVSSQDAVSVFLRAEGHPNDALLCTGGGDLDLAAFIPEAQACLKRISENG
ncbi:MAG: hypothetical protein WBB85_12030 [Albidovulum sp.]|uniref:hypothetical protein n=1 Tax=Albidovulum sp. TaxID=1872424 RepID=UPI003C8B135F